MIKKYSLFILVILLIAICIKNTSAQKKTTIPLNKKYNIDEIDTFGRRPIKNGNKFIYLYVPEFYSPIPRIKQDTLYEYKCFNKIDSPILFVDNFDSVWYLSIYKNYYDPNHLIINRDGNQVPQYVSKFAYRYENEKNNKWNKVDIQNNSNIKLLTNKNRIVHIDTQSITDPLTEDLYMYIYKYYKAQVAK